MNDDRSIFFKYRKIVFAVVLFMVADAVVIGVNFYNTYKSDESAVSINLSGRQRMLSQRMTKALLMTENSLARSRNVATKANLKELNLAVKLFDTTLKGFRDGGMVTGGDGNPVFLTQVETDESRKAVEETYEIWDYYLGLLQPLLSKNQEFSEEELEGMLEFVKNNPDTLTAALAFAQMNNLKILQYMNDLTTDLEHVANKRASTLRIVLLAGIFFALVNFAYTVVVSIRDLILGDHLLAQSRKETAEILATVREGLFLLDKDKKIGTQFSSSLPDILRRDIQPGADFMPHLEAIAPRSVYEAAVDYIELLLGDRVKESLVTSLNPLTDVPVLVTDTRGDTQTRYLSFFFNRVITAEQISHLLVTVQDVTDKAVLAQQVEQAKNQAKAEIETLLRLANSDFDTLQRFITNVGESLAQINAALSESHEEARERMRILNQIMRLVHGIKGEAAVLGIDMLESYAHDCEKEMIVMRDDENFGGDQMLRVVVLLEGFYQQHSSLAQVVSRLGSALGKAHSAEREDAAEDTPRKQPFVDHITALAERIAADHGKQVKVSCQLEKMFSLPNTVTRELQDISVQLVRNALAHGIEAPDKRNAHNKPLIGRLSLRCESLGHGRHSFTVRDDGCGIVPERLRKLFVEKGFMTLEEASALSDKEIATRLFLPGVSTAETPDQDSGHGIGLDVVLEKVKRMGGHMLVRSSPDKFTEFSIQFSTTP
ncbi:MAG: ATP-binding protein [Betaproteobacteria bacterium]|nr:ATP-binding protein [Betaproteobacteria bacterium]